MKFPKLEFPALFGTEEYPFSGIAAKEDIKHRETVLAVPHSAIMTHEKARNVELKSKCGNHTCKFGTIMDLNPELFTEECDDAEQLTLVLFIMIEMVCKEKSEWLPYINMLPDIGFYCDWPISEIEAL